MKDILVNALGEPCPTPVVKTMKAYNQMQEPGVLEVHVDNEVAVQNLRRFATEKQLPMTAETLDPKHFVVKLTVSEVKPGAVTAPEAAAEVICAPDARGNTVVAIGSNCMGHGNDELGATLMKGFIYALSQLDTLPKTILFFNGGAQLTVEGAVSVEDLKSMEAQGVEILTCGTCLNFYGLTEKLAVGKVTNMYDIAERLNKAGKVIRI